jgi:hypothetical protein
MSHDEEKVRATKSLLFLGILTIAVWVALGTAALWMVSSTAGLIFLGFSTFSILIVMRRQMCSSCYYCASCTKGFAKTSKLFLGDSRIPGIAKGTTIGMTVFIYVILAVIPGTLLVSSIIQELSVLKLSLLISLLTVSAYNAIMRARKMRD